MRVCDVHGGGLSALLAGFGSEREALLQDETLVIFFLQVCPWVTRKVLRQDLENTVDWMAYDGPLRCTCALDNYTVLASGHWRTTQAGDFFIAEIPSLCSGRKAITFLAFLTLNNAYTNTA